jgi:hypothetical protein
VFAVLAVLVLIGLCKHDFRVPDGCCGLLLLLLLKTLNNVHFCFFHAPHLYTGRMSDLRVISCLWRILPLAEV